MLCVMGSGGRALAQGTWTQYAGGPERTSTLSVCEFDPSSLATPAWIAQRDSQNRVITFVGQQCPMVSRTDVYAIGSVQSGTARLWRLYCFNRRSGSEVWEATVPATVADSWSSCAIDQRLNRIVVASGQVVSCFDLLSGAQRWQRTLPLSVINASPCITQDRVLANRVFVTDSDGASGGGHLYCINTDQFVPGINPYQPGAIVWTAALNGTSGNTAAYQQGVVFVTSAGEYQSTSGAVQAFDATTGSQIWRTENVIFEGYFGGVGLCEEGGKWFVLASSYGFFGDTWASNTECLDAQSGVRMWSAKTNRSAAIPVRIASNAVTVSGGVSGYGSTPTLQLIRDKGSVGTTIWSSLGQSRMGGWSTQPVFDAQHGRLYLGELPQNSMSFGAGIRLHVIDTNELNNEGQLSEQVFSGFGSSPAIAGRNLYCLGASGLYAFGAAPVNGDVNHDGYVDMQDLHEFFWMGGFDVDGNGRIDAMDYDLINYLTRVEDENAWYEWQRKH